MTVNIVSSTEYEKFLRWQNQVQNEQNEDESIFTNGVETVDNEFVSIDGETCTDGEDDGKIGFLSAVGNAIEGIGKTIVDGVKGMFTDENGNFSLGKTLLTVGTAALCIAVPAVGVAACAIGGTMGAIQVGKGIYNAATAESDAEAKLAWQDVGGGAFTVGAAVVGAKAGMKAVKNTAGANSALANLDDTATLTQKATALGKDMVTSTKNQLGKAGQAAANAKPTVTNAMKHPVETAKSAWQALKDTYKAGKNQITKENAGKIWDIIKSSPKKLASAAKDLKGTQAKIAQALTSGETTYAQAVQKFGFENVAAVLKYLSGSAISEANI